MLDIILWVLVGAFIGWHTPQPIWAKMIQAAIMTQLRKLTSK